MNLLFWEILNEIEKKHESLELSIDKSILDTTEQMILLLTEKLDIMKQHVISSNFKSIDEEIIFFKDIKPYVHGLLIFYKNIYDVETTCPIGSDKEIVNHYNNFLEKLSKTNKRHYQINSFYQYIKSKRTDKDELFFLRFKNKDIIYKHNQSFVFIDHQFTTFYDTLLSLIISEKKIYFYIKNKIDHILLDYNNTTNSNLNWSNSKSSMIELIYALHISKSIPQSNIRKIASVFEQVFGLKLGDIHHTYHRMKYRTNSRTLFLDQLKEALESHLGQNDQ